jgi:hypothetical protein
MIHRVIDINKPYQYFCNTPFFEAYPVDIFIYNNKQDNDGGNVSNIIDGKFLTSLRKPNNISNLNLTFDYPINLDINGYLQNPINANTNNNNINKSGNLHHKESCKNNNNNNKIINDRLIALQDANFTDNHLIMGGILGLAAILIIVMSIAKYRHNTSFDEEYNF